MMNSLSKDSHQALKSPQFMSKQLDHIHLPSSNLENETEYVENRKGKGYVVIGTSRSCAQL